MNVTILLGVTIIIIGANSLVKKAFPIIFNSW